MAVEQQIRKDLANTNNKMRAAILAALLKEVDRFATVSDPMIYRMIRKIIFRKKLRIAMISGTGKSKEVMVEAMTIYTLNNYLPKSVI